MKILFTLCFSLLTACQGAGPGVSKISIPATADRGAAEVYFPAAYARRRDWPIVVLLHGYLENSGFIDGYFGLSTVVALRGFVLVVPNGEKDSHGAQFWNATPGCCNFDHRPVDDSAYLTNLVLEVRTRFAPDTKQIAAAGHSNGAFMAYRLACDHADLFSSVVSFAGETFLNEADCKASAPVSVLQIQAEDDDTIHFGGDPVGYPNLAPYPGAAETVARWAARNHCASPPVAGTPLHLVATAKGTETSTLEWKNCDAGSKVNLWTIAAHSSPSGFSHTPFLDKEFTERLLDFLRLPPPPLSKPVAGEKIPAGETSL